MVCIRAERGAKMNWNKKVFMQGTRSPRDKYMTTKEDVQTEVLFFLDQEKLKPEQIKITETDCISRNYRIIIFYHKPK